MATETSLVVETLSPKWCLTTGSPEARGKNQRGEAGCEKLLLDNPHPHPTALPGPSLQLKPGQDPPNPTLRSWDEASSPEGVVHRVFVSAVNNAIPQLIKAATAAWKTTSQNFFVTFFSVLFSN